MQFPSSANDRWRGGLVYSFLGVFGPTTASNTIICIDDSDEDIGDSETIAESSANNEAIDEASGGNEDSLPYVLRTS